MNLRTALDVQAGDVVAIVGGGGKTHALYRLGAELAARGVPVLLSGTARFTPPERGDVPNLRIVASWDALDRALAAAPGHPLTAASGWGTKGRLLPLPCDWIDALHARRPELAIVLEADGSAMRPFKAPGDAEPVVPASATLVVAVAGMDAAGRPLDATHVHRPERVAALTGLALGEAVTAAAIATVLAHRDGGRKAVPPGARWAALLNKADTPERQTVAVDVATRLSRCGHRSLIARLKHEPPVIEVVDAERTGGAA